MDKKIKFNTKNLDLFYGDFQALKSINLEICEKEVTAFIGPSGCGKSTFLRCLNRMNDLIEGVKINGEILFDDEDINGEIDVINLRTRVAWFFRNPTRFR